MEVHSETECEVYSQLMRNWLSVYTVRSVISAAFACCIALVAALHTHRHNIHSVHITVDQLCTVTSLECKVQSYWTRLRWAGSHRWVCFHPCPQSTAAYDADNYNAGAVAGDYSVCLQMWSRIITDNRRTDRLTDRRTDIRTDRHHNRVAYCFLHYIVRWKQNAANTLI